MKNRFKNIISDKRYLIILYVLFALIASNQAFFSKSKTYDDSKFQYKKYNNYVIFANSFQHLKSNEDLYILYPEEQWDLYKYTPTFSVFFSVFSVLPDWLGLNLWNLLNSLLLLFAIYYLPRFSNYQKGIVLLLVLIELLTSMQNSQSNGLMAGLIIMTFGLLENKKYLLATLLIVFSVYIKLFGIVGFALFLFYPNKWKMALYSLFWSVVLFVMPLIFVDINQYLFLLESYANLLIYDHTASLGFSIMGWLNTWFNVSLDKNITVLLGVIIFTIPLILKINSYKDLTFRYLLLASILIWIVIFNHKAESPTFIIAMAGAALWFANSEKSRLDIALIILAFVFTSLSPTDLFPRFIRNNYLIPYVVKAVPCILIWFKISYELYSFDSSKRKFIQIGD